MSCVSTAISHGPRGVELGDVLDVGAVVRVVARRGREPAVEDLLEQRLGRRAQAEREHVRVVPGARAARRLGVRAERRPDARDLVGGDRGAGARPAADDALLRLALGHVARRALAGPRPVVALALREGAVHDGLVTALAQLLDHRAREGVSMSLATEILHAAGRISGAPATVPAVSERDQSTAPDDVAAQRGDAEDATGRHDISFYRQSALSRLVTHRGRAARSQSAAGGCAPAAGRGRG